MTSSCFVCGRRAGGRRSRAHRCRRPPRPDSAPPHLEVRLEPAGDVQLRLGLVAYLGGVLRAVVVEDAWQLGWELELRAPPTPTDGMRHALIAAAAAAAAACSARRDGARGAGRASPSTWKGNW